MSVDVTSYPSGYNYKWLPKPVEDAKYPFLYDVALFTNRADGTGDATAGYFNIYQAVLPQAPISPQLPRLEAWFRLLGVNIRTASSMKGVFSMNNDFPTSSANPNTLMADAVAALIDGGDLFFYYTNEVWKEWLAHAEGGSGIGGVNYRFESNVNLQGYRLDCFGLIMKTEQQLRTEGLWLPQL